MLPHQQQQLRGPIMAQRMMTRNDAQPPAMRMPGYPPAPSPQHASPQQIPMSVGMGPPPPGHHTGYPPPPPPQVDMSAGYHSHGQPPPQQMPPQMPSQVPPQHHPQHMHQGGPPPPMPPMQSQMAQFGGQAPYANAQQQQPSPPVQQQYHAQQQQPPMPPPTQQQPFPPNNQPWVHHHPPMIPNRPPTQSQQPRLHHHSVPSAIEAQELKIPLVEGSCRKCHMQPTIYQVPISKDILDTSGLEFSVVVQPFNEGEVDGTFFVPLSPNPIIRCNRCKAYINPFSKNGQCCICNFTTNRIQEMDQKPELNLGSYEFRVTSEYYRDQIAETRRPHIIFAIEMTVHSRHLVQYLSKNLANIIKSNFPNDFLYSASLSPLVGFLTYNSKITIYDVINGGHAYILSDISSVKDYASTSKFLLDPYENFEAMEKFLESLTDLCSEQLESEQQCVLGPVIDAALKTCIHDTSNYFQRPNSKVIPTGKLYILHSSLPTSGDDTTPGKLHAKRNIDDLKRQLGTDSESKILAPEGKFYTQLAQKCINDYATGVELFLFPPNPRTYLNIATIGDLARLTGTGIVHKYHSTSIKNFVEDLKFSLSSTMGFDASMRVRTSTGISPVKYIGNFNCTLGSNLEMATVNTNSNFIVQMKYDDKIPENDLVVVQFAMIYTSVCGERRVRVHNLALTTCQTLPDLYKTACCDTLMNVIARDVIDKMRLGTLTPRTAKEQMTTRVISILSGYRKHCTDNQTSSSQLILPEGLKLMPVYLCGALKCDAIDGGMEMFPDDKVLAQINLLGSLPPESHVTFYPRMYSIEACSADDEENELGLTAKLTRCLHLFIDEGTGQCYVLENGYYLFIFFPNTDLGRNFLESVYGQRKDDPDLVWDNRQRDSNETLFLDKLVAQIVAERRRALTISVVRQGRDKLENVFNSFLYEDKKRPDSSMQAKLDNLSYVDMLCFLHAEIRTKLSQ